MIFLKSLARNIQRTAKPFHRLRAEAKLQSARQPVSAGIYNAAIPVTEGGKTQDDFDNITIIVKEDIKFAYIPIVDMNDPLWKVAKDIDAGARDIGFFHVVNHKVSPELQHDMFEGAKFFFARDKGFKRSINMNPSNPKRGYFSFGQEDLNFEDQVENYKGDLKEGFDVGYDTPNSNDTFGQNQWPEGMIQFRKNCETYLQLMKEHNQWLMRVTAIAMNMPETYFENKINDPMATLRLLHYKPQLNVKQQLGCAAHSDYGAYTSLLQDDVGGLEVRGPDMVWRSVAPMEGSYVTNLGDMLQYWTGNCWKSTVHKVVNTSDRDRYSIPFFFNPNRDVVIEPLGTEADGNGAHERLTCEEYLQARYQKSKIQT